MWGGGPPPSARRQLLHPVSGQPVAYPPLHGHRGSVYINRSYEKAEAREDPAHKEMIVIDYSGGGEEREARSPVQVVDLTSREEVSITGHHPALYLYDPAPPVHPVMSSGSHYHRFPGDSRGSDTSSLYSGSDTMHSLQSGQEEVDLSGLHESVVDSDEEDLAESIGSFTLRDAVRDCLEKDPVDRGEEDVEILMEFTHTLEAFADMTQAVRRKMCEKMVFAVVDKAGTVVMNDGEELDSWSVIINGAVRVEGPSRCYTLSLGQGFGIKPTMAKEFHQGVMTTVVEDCQFVCITQADYYKILHEGEDALVREEDEQGELVKVSEVRRTDDGQKHAKVLLRASPSKLVEQLVEDTSSADPNYIEDFLLCHRIFLDSSLEVVRQLLSWFESANLRDRVTRILLLWVNNHFTDFELDSDMMELLDGFESRLESAKMQGQLRMLNFACAAKARPRLVSLTRSSRDEELEFSLTGGYNRGGIFVQAVMKGSTAARKGLKRGDQILDVNGESFQHVMTLERAVEILTKQTLLQVNVKSNFLAFKEANNLSSDRKKEQEQGESSNSLSPAMANMSLQPGLPVAGKGRSTKDKIMGKVWGLMRKPSKLLDPDQSEPGIDWEDGMEDATPKHSLKIFKADQSHRFLLVNKDTKAREVVMLSLKEFGITECSTNFAMVEVLVDNGFVKQRRLADATVNLAQRIGLASRYYIKNVAASQQLVPEEIAGQLLAEASVNLLQLTPEEIATQLMVEDFTVFRQIEQTEYVDDLFKLKSNFGTANLERFSNLVNKETLWVVSELVGERKQSERVRIVKHFLKVAKQCKEVQNFNSMFAVISGLNHHAIARMKQTWERVPEKYTKLLADLNMIMDPSRNFSRYRNLIKSESTRPPLIPIYPMVSKDLAFVDIGNKSKVEGLVNMEKLRLVAKEIRALTAMCSAPLRNVPDNVIAMNENDQTSKYATMKRRGGARNAPDAGGMYKEALMIRKVKAYLNTVFMNIITDEEVLQRMSVEVEPNLMKASVHSISGSSLRTARPPSPTPSRASSLSVASEGKKSNASGKFGASSPERERKLLSLAEDKPQDKAGNTAPDQKHDVDPGLDSDPDPELEFISGMLGKIDQSKRKLTKLSKSSYSLSPGPSPVSLRRDSLTEPSLRHERSHSDTPAIPVSLTAESCSVASLPGFRRGSVSSTGEGEGEKGCGGGGGGERMAGGKGRRRSRQRPASSGHAPALELPPRGGTGAPPPRPPDYISQQQQQGGASSGYQGASSKHGRGSRVSRTQSRESGGRAEEEEETQVSAV